MNRVAYPSQFSWRHLLLIFVPYLFLLSAASAQAQPSSRPLNADYPSFGLFLDTKEHAAIQFACTLAEGSGILHCDFFRSHIRTDLDPSALQKFVADETAAMKKDGPMDTKLCPELSQRLAGIGTAPGLDNSERKILEPCFKRR